MDEQREGPAGGLAALAGFLFQTVGTLGLTVGAFQKISAEGTTDLDTVLGFASTGEVRYEHFDQDATIKVIFQERNGPGYILIQFKYSRTDPPRPIPPAELLEIADRLKTSAKQAQSLGHQVIGYVLLTNRTLSKEAEMEIQNARASIPSKRPKATNVPLILQLLCVVKPISMEYWEQLLWRFAFSHGCVQSALHQGLDRCIGLLNRRASTYGAVSITKEDLVEAFVGFPKARLLTPDVVAQCSRKQLTEMATRRTLTPYEKQMIRRDVLTDLSRKTETFALVVLTGSGGNGKTATLWHWIDECLTSALPAQRGVYYALISAEEASDDCLAEQLCSWADLPSSHAWHLHKPEYILEQLQAASGMGNRPLVFLGLDAVDEALLTRDRPRLCDLLRWFWREGILAKQEQRLPRATAVVTCRSQRELTRNWLQVASPFGDLDEHTIIATVDVLPFTSVELREVARMSLSQKVSARLEKALIPGERSELVPLVPMPSTLPSPLLFPGSFPSAPAVDRRILQSLHHPVLWRCFLALNDQNVQTLVLDGESSALHRLAAIFFGWFVHKVKLRGYLLSEHNLKKVMQAVAVTSSQKTATHQSRADWIRAAQATGLTTEYLSEKLFEEAFSAGLIVLDDQDRWFWYHGFVGDFLATAHEREER